MLVQNPSEEVALARFTFVTSGGEMVIEEHQVAPGSRFTLCLGQVEGLTSDEVSTRVESLNGVPIVCERSVYFDFSGFLGGHDSIGYAP